MWTEEQAILHALRRNGIGARSLVALEVFGRAGLGRLHLATGSSRQRIKYAMRGKLPDCKKEHSLLRLRFVVERRTGARLEYEITKEGRRWAARVRRGLHIEEVVVRSVRGTAAE